MRIKIIYVCLWTSVAGRGGCGGGGGGVQMVQCIYNPERRSKRVGPIYVL